MGVVITLIGLISELTPNMFGFFDGFDQLSQ
jgi:hypothetical protein